MTHFLPKTIRTLRSKKAKYTTALSLFLMSLISQTAFADDPFVKTENLARQGLTKLQGVSLAIFAVVGVGVAIVYGVGGQELKRKMKSHAGAIAIAVIGVAAIPAALEWLYNFVQ